MTQSRAAPQAYNADTMSFELPDTDMVRYSPLLVTRHDADPSAVGPYSCRAAIIPCATVLEGWSSSQVYIDGIPAGTSEEELATHFGSIGDAPSRHPCASCCQYPRRQSWSDLRCAVLIIADMPCRGRQVRQEAGVEVYAPSSCTMRSRNDSLWARCSDGQRQPSYNWLRVPAAI